MNKPGRAAKGTNPYQKKGGGGKGPLSTGMGGFETGAKIDYLPEFPELEGQYLYKNGNVSTSPTQDTRGFFGKIFQPNTSLDINRKLELEKLTREELIPIIVKEEEAKQRVITQSVLERLQNEQKLNQPFQPVVNNFNAPGEVPFDYAGDPSALLADRQNQPYVPINPKGVEGNLAQQSQLAIAQRGAESAALGKSQLSLAEQELSQRIAEANRSKYMNVGHSLLEIPPQGSPALVGRDIPGDKGGEPVLGTDPTGKPTLQGFSKPSAGRFEMAPRVKGNMYQGGAASSPYTPPELNTSLRTIGPATTQQNNFVDGEATRNGMKVETKGPAGGAPTTQLENPLDALEKFNTENQERIKKKNIEEWQKLLLRYPNLLKDIQ